MDRQSWTVNLQYPAVEAQGWSDYTVDYEQIDSISYKENLFQNGNNRRTNGMGNLKYGMGNFRNDIYGDYIRYTHASCRRLLRLRVLLRMSLQSVHGFHL